ncbi:MAG: AIR synthase-related protein, partial [Candidatus Zipacnadales bacterium]
VRGIADAARLIGLKTHPGNPVPVVSGNVSFYNESAAGRAVEPSAIVACIGVLSDYSKALTMQLKSPHNRLYLVGSRYDECGGSAYYQALGVGLGANVPQVRWEEQRAAIFGMIDAIEAGLVAACHDISDGGMAVALAEMILGGYANGTLGAEIDLTPLASELRTDRLLFSESGGFIAEVKEGCEAEFEAIFKGQVVTPVCIGQVTTAPYLSIAGLLSVPISRLAEAWTTGLPTRLR